MDPWDAIALHHVFRDAWERRVPLEKPPERDVRSSGDYPELQAMFDQVNDAIEKDEAVSAEVDTSPYGPKCAYSSQGEADEPDRLWIYRHGGHMGEPLGSRRRTLTGPPRKENEVEESDYDDRSSLSFASLRSPSPLWNGSESAQPTAEVLPTETSAPPVDKELDQEADTTEQRPEESLGTSGYVEADNEQGITMVAPVTSDPGADGIGKKKNDTATDSGGGPVTSEQPPELPRKRKAEDEPSSE
jgi:hypothetical protein